MDLFVIKYRKLGEKNAACACGHNCGELKDVMVIADGPADAVGKFYDSDHGKGSQFLQCIKIETPLILENPKPADAPLFNA